MKTMNRPLKTVLAVIVCLAAFYALAGFVVLPMALKAMLPEKLSQALHRPVSVRDIRFNPFALSFDVQGFNIRDKNGSDPFISFGRLFIDLAWTSLIKLAPVVDACSLEKPDIHITRLSSNQFNFSDLLEGNKTATKTQTEKKSAAFFRFLISNVRIIDGSITFWDAPLKKKQVFSPINITLPFISNFKPYLDRFVKSTLKGRLNTTDVVIQLESKPFLNSIDTVVDISLSNILIPYYFDYAPNDLGFQITEGSMNIRSRISFSHEAKGSRLNIAGSADISNFKSVDRQGRPLLNLPHATIELAQCRPMDREVKVDSINLKSAELSILKDTAGKINLLSLGPQPEGSNKTQPDPAPSTDASSKPLQLEIKKIALDDCKVSFTDQAAGRSLKEHANPVQMATDNINLTVKGFSNAPGTQATYNMTSRINGEAAISAEGRASMSPLSIDSGFGIKDFQLQWIQPYLPDNIRLAIANGLFSASGQAEVRKTPEGRITASVKGGLSIDRFAAREQGRSKDFISWDIFSLENIDMTYNPLRLDIGTAALKKFNNRLIRGKDGKLNVQKIFVSSSTPAAPKKEAEKASPSNESPETVPIHIGQINMQDIGVQFTDRAIEPNFSARLNLSDARIVDIASQGPKPAGIFAKGTINEHAPLDIKGQINPLTKDLFLDMTADLSDLDLGPMSPYSGKYIGRTIEKGKLNLDLKYSIDQKKINGQNKLMLDRFTLGGKVNSPDALNLPVGLAVALLKDRDGKISLDVPVSGRTDDPNYKPGGLLLQALENIITKAAASPFDLVSSVIGGGEELRYIEFNPGEDAIDEASQKKLDAIKKLLYERPGLMLDLTGYADTDSDRKALAVMRLDQKIKDLKLDRLSGKEKAITAPEQVTVTPEEYEKYLKELYVSEVLSHPENKQTAKPVKDKTLTLDEMKAAVLQQIRISDDRLRTLAAKRTGAVKNYLLQGGQVEASRIFTKEGNTLSPKKVGDYSASRVELGVK